MTDSFVAVTDIDYQQLTKIGLTYFNRSKNGLLLTSGILVTFVELFNIKHIMNEELFPSCPIRNILSRFSDKWSLLILYTLNLQPTMRFNALRREIPDISQKMLTNTLRTLEEDGLVTRTIYAEVPPRVEYSITDRTRSLLPHVNSLIAWAKENMPAILRDRESHGKRKK
jgi:DNA-binding HxlR family transcriptional regulator